MLKTRVTRAKMLQLGGCEDREPRGDWTIRELGYLKEESPIASQLALRWLQTCHDLAPLRVEVILEAEKLAKVKHELGWLE